MIFRIKKVYVSINIYFLLMVGWVILTNRCYEFVYCLSALLLHEMGHIIMIYLLKEKISVFYVIPFGFSCRLKNQSTIEPKKLFKIVIAGPVTSFAMAGFAFFGMKNFAIINFLIAMINLIPMGNLDGGRIFRNLFKS